MVLGSRSLKGILLIDVLLEKIQIEKELFLHEVEEGRVAFIPRDLSQDHLPMSFRYYDPIIAFISENISF